MSWHDGVTNLDNVVTQIIPIAITKPHDPVELDGGKSGKGEKQYEVVGRMLLGSLLQRVIGQEIGLHESCGMEEFREYLHEKNTLHEVDKRFSAVAKRLKSELFARSSESEFAPTEWFTEVAFLPSVDQMEGISGFARELASYDKLAKTLGFVDTKNLLRHFLTDRDWRMPELRADGSYGPGCGVEEIYQIARVGEGVYPDHEQLDPRFVNLAEKLAGVSSYVLCDFGFDWNASDLLKELREGAERYKKVIMSASARVDFLGLKAKKADPDAQQVLAVVSKLLHSRPSDNTDLGFADKQLVRNWHFGRMPLLDFGKYSRLDRETMRRAVEMLVEGRISFDMVELKGHFGRDGSPDSSQELGGEYWNDVAHSVFAMWQWVRLVGRSGSAGEVWQDEITRMAWKRYKGTEISRSLASQMKFVRERLLGQGNSVLVVEYHSGIGPDGKVTGPMDLDQQLVTHVLAPRRLSKCVQNVVEMMMKTYLRVA